MRAGRMRRPLVAWNVRYLKERVIADHYRHGLGTQIDDRGFDLQLAIGQGVGHLVLVSERPLRHEIGIFPELEAAGDVRRSRIGRNLRHLPKRRRHQESVTRHVAADISQFHVEDVLLAVRPKRRLVQKVCPGRQKRYAAEPRPLLKFAYVGKWKVQNVLAMHLHLVSAIADARRHRDFHAVRRVAEANDRYIMIDDLFRLVILREGRHRQQQQCYGRIHSNSDFCILLLRKRRRHLSSSKYPIPRTVWISLSGNGSSTLDRKRRMWTSTKLVLLSKLISHT